MPPVCDPLSGAEVRASIGPGVLPALRNGGTTGQSRNPRSGTDERCVDPGAVVEQTSTLLNLKRHCPSRYLVPPIAINAQPLSHPLLTSNADPIQPGQG